MFRVFVFNVNT